MWMDPWEEARLKAMSRNWEEEEDDDYESKEDDYEKYGY